MRDRDRAPAKVNLRLRVREREPSGFHRLETLFCALELADEITLEVEEGRDVRLDVDGPVPGPPEENLAVRAARAFLRHAGLERSIGIRLRKRIPAGGGLGGGSSDAAAVLRGLDRLLPGALSASRLRDLALDLGSDVPFFLSGSVLSWGAGRGEILTRAEALPSAPVLLLFPGFPVSTRDAYGWLDRDRADAGSALGDDGLAAARTGPASWDEAAALAANDFEGPVFRRHPELRRLRDLLREADARIALLSGSGSSLFGIFADDLAAHRAIALLRSRAPDTHIEQTRTASR